MTGEATDVHEGLYTFKAGRPWRVNSILEKILLVLVVLFLLTTIIFIVLYVTRNTKSHHGDVCTSRNCIISAGLMSQKMDPTVDPCDNFADYACGGYYRDAVIPSDQSRIGAFVDLMDKNLETSKAIIQEPTFDADPDYLKKAKALYQTCFDEETIEKIGTQPYFKTSFPKDWPTLTPSWDSSTFDLKKVLKKYMPHIDLPFARMVVTTDMKESSRNVLYIAQPKLLVPARYLREEGNGSLVTALKTYYKDLAVELGADVQVATTDAQEYVNVLIQLANIMLKPEEQRNMSALYSPWRLEDVATRLSSIDLRDVLLAHFENVGITLPDDQRIVIYSPQFFDRLDGFLNQTTARVLQNMFAFRYASHVLKNLTKKIRKLTFKFRMIKDGTKQQMPRWKECLLLSAGVFGKGLGKEYVKRKFSEESKTYMKKMIGSLKSSFSELLKSADWMEEETKKEARLKFEGISSKIGYPDSNYTDSDIDEYYKTVTIVKDNYYESKRNIDKYWRTKELKKLVKPVDKEEWSMAPYEVNAYYNPSNNEIAFPAGILQPPFFSDIFTDSLNYGAIGSVIGHEITHGFDDGGSQFDHQGTLRNWWQLKDMQEFKVRTQCIIDQYSKFEHPQVKKKLNGIVSAGENIADIGGVKESFSAYQTYAASEPDELPLPGLGLTTQQQFFVAFAQLWCQKHTDEKLKDIILNAVHLPGRFRIIGALQNSEDFAKVFQCPVGSYMNPAKKCVVW